MNLVKPLHRALESINELLSQHAWLKNRYGLLIFTALIAATTLFGLSSRVAQYDLMKQTPLAYFYVNGLASTSPDSGFFLEEAKRWEQPITNKELELSVFAPGRLPGFLIWKVSDVFAISREVAARYLLYFGVVATQILSIIFFTLHKQPVIGLFSATAVLAWPIYMRTAVGMVDTDLGNLFFVLLISIAIGLLKGNLSNKKMWAIPAVAGLLNYIFYLWYGRPGFTIVFAVCFFVACVLYRYRWHGILGIPLVFILFSGWSQALNSYQSLLTLLYNYVSRAIPNPTVTNSEITNDILANLTSDVFKTISEVTPISYGWIVSDFGSFATFVLALTGIALWLFQDYRRIACALPMLGFLGMYLTSGLRFSFYAAPLLFGGIAASALLATQWLLSLRIIQSKKWANGLSTRPWILSPVLVIVAWSANVYAPWGTHFQPFIPTRELFAIGKSIEVNPNKKVILASLWDYGSELNYQFDRPVIASGANPAALQTLYFGRAMISYDPFYSADEIRFAAYADGAALNKAFPNRPPLNEARNLDHDVLLILPSDLQHKLPSVFQVAAKGFREDHLKQYDPKQSVFYTLYGSRPAKFGPFEKVIEQEDGMVVYRLPAPALTKK